MTEQNDSLIGFIFENTPVRGKIIKLNKSLISGLQNHNYPLAIKNQLTQAILATNLLADTVKFKGRLSLQAQSKGELELLLVQARHDLSFRAVARYSSNLSSSKLAQLMPHAQMAITIEPNAGKRYQGIVPMEKANLGENLQDYFAQSEQLDTRIWLFNNNENGFGLMLQAIPDDNYKSEDFEHLSCLVDTLKEEEALNLPAELILHRLFHQDPLRLFEPKAVTYRCGCSKEKILSSLITVPQSELNEVLKDEGEVKVDCEFCNSSYIFDSIDIEQIYANLGHNLEPPQKH